DELPRRVGRGAIAFRLGLARGRVDGGAKARVVEETPDVAFAQADRAPVLDDLRAPQPARPRSRPALREARRPAAPDRVAAALPRDRPAGRVEAAGERAPRIVEMDARRRVDDLHPSGVREPSVAPELERERGPRLVRPGDRPRPRPRPQLRR